jgi:hypothetical protein
MENNMTKKLRRVLVLASTVIVLALTPNRLPADTGTCGGVTITLPFTDVAGNLFFCQIAEAFFSGLTNGTTPTTYSPSANVPRDQMAAFITRTQDSALRRGSRRASLNQWATPASLPFAGRIAVGNAPLLVESDGVDLWVADNNSADVRRVRASDGSPQGTWIGATGAFGVLVARGRVWVSGSTNLYVIDPSNAPGMVATVFGTTFVDGKGIATDGTYIWTCDQGGSVMVATDPDTGQAHFIVGGFSQPEGVLFDGANLWVTDQGANMLRKLGSPTPNIIQNVPVGAHPQFPVFDGANIWVPNSNSDSVTVVRARDGMILATLTGNGLSHPIQAAFDGQRVLVTDNFNSLSMWKASDLTPIGNFPTGQSTLPFGVCSDGVNFWITLSFQGQLARL